MIAGITNNLIQLTELETALGRLDLLPGNAAEDSIQVCGLQLRPYILHISCRSELRVLHFSSQHHKWFVIDNELLRCVRSAQVGNVALHGCDFTRLRTSSSGKVEDSSLRLFEEEEDVTSRDHSARVAQRVELYGVRDHALAFKLRFPVPQSPCEAAFHQSQHDISASAFAAFDECYSLPYSFDLGGIISISRGHNVAVAENEVYQPLDMPVRIYRSTAWSAQQQQQYQPTSSIALPIWTTRAMTRDMARSSWRNLTSLK